jgi:hypothetical protein
MIHLLFGLNFFPALTVRLLTKRFIGEYDRTLGENQLHILVLRTPQFPYSHRGRTKPWSSGNKYDLDQSLIQVNTRMRILEELETNAS